MFATPAFAQAAQGGGADLLANSAIIPIIAMFVIMYFFMIRPQQKRAKQHREMVAALRRGDTIVTSGGLIGKVAKVAENEVMVDLAEGVQVRVVRSTISEVRGKTEPAAIEAKKPAADRAKASRKKPQASAPAEDDKPDAEPPAKAE